MTRSAIHRGGVILVACVMAACNFTPAADGAFGSPNPTPTGSTSGEALDGGSSIQPYVPGAAGSLTGSDALPGEIEPPAALLPVAAAIAESVNRLRVATGVEPLVIDDELTRIAFARSADMVLRDYLSHEDPGDGSNLPWRLLTDAGFGGHLGENIFATQAKLEDVVDEAVDGWLRSPEHRATALDPAFHYTGVCLMSDGEWWKVTQVFVEQLP
jgi:uncharacterized protein YkwD